jgi:glycosyltransferase involved in cell wall biosynthesis
MTSFDIITPVFNAGTVVRTCMSSVRDQGPNVNHHVQDGASTDPSTREALALFPSCVTSESDAGMYDALNRALARCTGEIIGHLNADEQYLPNIIDRVRSIFDLNPAIDVVCGDLVLTDADWNPLSYRRSVLPPANSAGLIPLPVPTCATFIRKRLFDRGLSYRADLKAIADAILVQDLIRMKARWYFDRRPYAAFSIHETNLSNSSAAAEDKLKLSRSLSPLGIFALRLQVWIKRLVAGAFRVRSVEIDVFTPASLEKRVKRSARRIFWGWPKPSNAGVRRAT